MINLHISQAVAPHGLYYAPDPSSQKACTIGGNVAENAGGPHCLRYGSTMNHVLGLEIVTPDGEIVWLGGSTPDPPGYDLTGVVVGSEGTLCIVTKVIVRLLPKAGVDRSRCSRSSTRCARRRRRSRRSSPAGVLPAALEMIDKQHDGRGGGGRCTPATRRTPAPRC